MALKKPEVSSGFAQKELDRAEKQFEEFEENIKSLTKDRMDSVPRSEEEQQTKMSSTSLANSKDIYLKPIKRIGCKERFNESFRKAFEYASELVKFTAENKEIIGESIDMWTRPFPGMPAEEWLVPVNKPVWGPRYLFEQLKRKYYHRLVMQDHSHSSDGMGTYYGTMAVDSSVPRLDAHEVSDRKQVFMGYSGRQ